MATSTISINPSLGPVVEGGDAYAAAMVQFRALFNNKLGLVQKDPLRILCWETPSESAAEQHIFLGDLPAFRAWTGDRRMGQLEAHKIFIQNRDWSSGIAIHRSNILDDQLGLFMPNIAMLPEKGERHKGQFITEALISGFGTAPNFGSFTDPSSWLPDGTCYDGENFFATTHTLEGGPNQSNLITDTLSDTGLENAYITMRKLKSFDGRDPLEISPTTIICGPSNEPMAKRLCEQEIRVRVPGDATATFQTGAESNIWKGRFNYLVSSRLTAYSGGTDYSNYWFLAALNEGPKPVIFQDREPINMVSQTSWENDAMFETGKMRFGAQARYGIGLYEWRTIIGSTGVG